MNNIALYTIAAFISAGMHRDVERLDEARDALDTGCFELVSTAMTYTDYIQALYEAGYNTVGSVPGVFDYEVAEEFGVWYVKEALEEQKLPDVQWAMAELYKLAMKFWSHDGDDATRSRLVDALGALENLPQPEL